MLCAYLADLKLKLNEEYFHSVKYCSFACPGFLYYKVYNDKNLQENCLLPVFLNQQYHLQLMDP